MNQEETVNRVLARSYLYHLSSLLFLYPEETVLSSVGWEEAGKAVAFLGSPDGLKETLESLKGSLKSVDAMRSEFSRVFGYTLQCDCPPYETLYGSGGYAGANTQLAGAQVFEQSQTLGDIAGFYRAFGLEVSNEIKERLDYISIELEFMSFLAYKEAYALISDGGEDEKAERVEICQDAQRKFLNDHLGRWALFFTDRLAEKAKDGFYLWLARLTGKFLTCEIKAIEAQPVRVEGLAPIAPETEGLCETCVTKDACFSEEKELPWGAPQSVF